ncbi:MAG: hypothetical protein LC725_01150 [Lentisphaerae bacterium]|nr:hypothetical protein [Lentisphaerota bacterium]
MRKYGIVCVASVLLCVQAMAAEYFVSLAGSDNQDGMSRAAAFATIQKGVDALAPGDTLTILPGEYLESARRADLGSDDVATTIRADIPGTVVLRGDIPAPAFRAIDHPGAYTIYTAELDPGIIVRTVNELDTLMVLPGTSALSDLQFTPGVFYQDAESGRLYITTVDNRPAAEHRYSLSVLEGHGLHLSSARDAVGPRRVVVEGLAATGYNAVKYRDEAGIGIALDNARGCVVRECRAWLNGWGIQVSAEAEGSGSNVIEHCAAWANDSMFANSRIGGIIGIRHRGDIIRESTAFLNANCGIYLREDADPELTSRLQYNLAWGNRWNYIIKGNPGYINTTENCVALAQYALRKNARYSLFFTGGRSEPDEAPGTIILTEEENLDLNAEFADPENHDYRLQATSRFRGTGPDGTDRGPFPYQPNIFYVATNGNDLADGLSVGSAWQTFARAVKDLKAGDTLYLGGGRYAAANLEQAGTAGPADRSGLGAVGHRALPSGIVIRGRGRAVPVLDGPLALAGMTAISFERVAFAGPVSVLGAGSAQFENLCLEMIGATSAPGHPSGGLDLRGNLFWNSGAPAVVVERMMPSYYSDYNAFRDPAAAWEINGARVALADAPEGCERYSVVLPEGYEPGSEPTQLTDRPAWMSAGPLGYPFGPVWVAPRQRALSLARAPYVHAVSTGTADIEWGNLLPARVRLAWGATPDLENHDEVEVDYFGSYSLTGLEPGKTYYFRIEALDATGKAVGQHIAWRPGTMDITGGPVAGDLLTFTTPEADAAPVTYWVAPDGDDAADGRSRECAWRTIQHAADRVRAGDTVLIAGGTYEEQVRVRTSGAPGAPITFRSAPGEQVILSAGERELGLAFDVLMKHHLRFDGMYLLSKCFRLNASSHIEITRMFAGRFGSGYAPALFYATDCGALTIRNSVSLSGKSGPSLHGGLDYVRIENCVFFRNMIQQLAVSAARKQTVEGVVARNIFTDGLDKKFSARMLGISVAGYNKFDPLDFSDNCFYPRRDWDRKQLVNGWTFAELDTHLGETRSLLANPEFAGLAGVPEKTESGTPIYPPDRMCGTGAISLDKFFATNPELVKRGIGLQPEAFADFHFNAQNQD